jgi:hypothetical protein
MRPLSRVMSFSIALLVAGLIPAPAAADYWVFTWQGTMTGHGSLADVVPPDTPFYFELIFDANAPNTCPPGSSPIAGNYQGVQATLTILGWKYTSRAAYAEVNSPSGNCVGILIHTLFRTWRFDANPPDQLDPDAGPPIVWHDDAFPVGWQLFWPGTEAPTILTDLPPDVPPQSVFLFTNGFGGINGSGDPYVWLWTPDPALSGFASRTRSAVSTSSPLTRPPLDADVFRPAAITSRRWSGSRTPGLGIGVTNLQVVRIR